VADNQTTHDPASAAGAPRRTFVTLCAGLVGALAGLVPLAAGVLTFLDPLRRRAAAGEFVRVTSLAALPEDGLPRKFTVLADRADAWNRFPRVPVGAVYLRRTGPDTVQALNVVCPHAGCFVDFKPQDKFYLCPCHNSTFDLDGRIRDAKSPSPRALDALDVQIRPDGEVWVKFQNFQAGTKEKKPLV
jgi:menaquinol-cytochrome c reductase iron-sulfur subunit